MKLLYVVPYAPTLIRVRPYNLLRSLARRGHSITLGTTWTTTAEREALGTLSSAGIKVISSRLSPARSLWNCARALARPTPLQSVYNWAPQLFDLLRSELRDSHFDLLHVEHLRGASYGTRLQREAVTLPLIWDSVDCISFLFQQTARDSRAPFGRRLAAHWELPRTRRYEPWLVRQFHRTLVTSERDRSAFCQLLEDSHTGSALREARRLRVLGNGVDFSYFKPGVETREPQTIVLSGKMSYHANVSAASYLVQEVMPRVWSAWPEARVQIVGQNPTAQVRALARNHAGRVSVTGTVSDIRPYLARAALAVAPLTYGAGIQNKVLEAMATATPVVATSAALAGLPNLGDSEVLVGDDAAALSAQIVRLLGDPGLGCALGGNGRRFVQTHHDWNQVAACLEDIYREAILEHGEAS